MTDVSKRNIDFALKYSTSIWHEVPSDKNAYIAKEALLHGYDFSEFPKQSSYVDMLFLMLSGRAELPNKAERRLFEAFLMLFMNPGPRSAPVQAAVTAAISKTHAGHILPIGLTTLAGDFLGVEQLLQAYDALVSLAPNSMEENSVIAGFGTRYGGIDTWTGRVAYELTDYAPDGGYIQRCNDWLCSQEEVGWLPTGLAAATFLDLDIGRDYCPGLYQIAVAPGITAHAAEYRGKHMSALSFVDDESYAIDE
jgi:citrate synthase